MKTAMEIMWKNFLFWGSFFVILGISMQGLKLVAGQGIELQITVGGFVCLAWGIWGMLVETAMSGDDE